METKKKSSGGRTTWGTDNCDSLWRQNEETIWLTNTTQLCKTKVATHLFNHRFKTSGVTHLPLSLSIQLFLVFNKINSAEPFPFLPKLLPFLLFYTFPCFYLMFLCSWGLQHLASCPISVRSGGWFWMGGISGAAAPSFDCLWRCSCIHPSKMFQSPLLLKHSQVFSFLYRCLFLFAFLWVSNRKTRISKNTELLCIWYKIKIWASEYYWQCSILQWIYI